MLKILTIGAVAAGGAMAGELPELDEKPWLGCFAGFEGRGYDLAVGADGKSELFFKKGSNRVNLHSVFKVNYLLEEEINGKWVRRRIADDGYETKDKPSDSGDSVTFIATFTGDTKVEISHEFGKTEVIIGAKIVGKTTKNPLRCGVEVVVADLYKHLEEKGMSERDLKKKVDAEIAGETRKGGRVKADLYKKPKLSGPDYFEGGATWFSFESDKIAGKEMKLSSVEDKSGWIEVKQTRDAFHGFYLKWWVDPARAETKGAKLQIDIK